MAKSILLRVPKEVRLAILKHFFTNATVVCGASLPGQALADRQYDPAILITSRQVYKEALTALMDMLTLHFIHGASLDDLSAASKAKFLPLIQNVVLDDENSDAFKIATFPALQRLALPNGRFDIPIDIKDANEYEDFITGGYDEDLASWARDSQLEEEPDHPVSKAYNHPGRKFSIVHTFFSYPYGDGMDEDNGPRFSISYDMDTLAIVKKFEQKPLIGMTMDGQTLVRRADGTYVIQA